MEPDPEKMTPDEFAEAIREQAGVIRRPARKKKNWPDTVRPSRGKPYTRCPVCNAQIYASASKKAASATQMGFASAVALAEHKREKHPEGSQ